MRDSLLDYRGCSRKVSFVLEQSGAPFPAQGLIILVRSVTEVRHRELWILCNTLVLDVTGCTWCCFSRQKELYLVLEATKFHLEILKVPAH